MPKPDKVLRVRPLKELGAALLKLKRVVLFHPEPIVEELEPIYCVCEQPADRGPRFPTAMTQCDSCWEWFHNDCLPAKTITANIANEDFKCEWCNCDLDREGWQRWKSDRNKPKRRHHRDVPRLHGARLGEDGPPGFTAPPTWEGKVAQVKELARRAAIRKRN